MWEVNSDGNSVSASLSSTLGLRGWTLNTQYSEVVETLSRALGNTLDRYEEQEDSLTLHLRWPLERTDQDAVKTVVRYLLPGSRVTFQKWRVVVTR